MERKRLGAGDYAIAALFATMIVVVTAQVVWRYVFDNSLDWTEEFSRHLFVWMTFVGAALAIKEGAHIRVDVLANKLPVAFNKWLTVAFLVIMAVFLGLLVFVGFQYVALTAGQRTPGLGLPLNYALYASLPVASLFGVWFALHKAVATMRRKEEPRQSREVE